MTAFADESIYSARLDSDVAGGIGELVETDIKDNSTGLNFLQLVSTNGAPDPASGHYHFSSKSSIDINNSLFANGGIIDHVDNQIDTVPEPMSLSLIALGFVLLNRFTRNALKISVG